MNTDAIAYIVGTGWLGGRILTVLVETFSNIVYGVKQTNRQRKTRSISIKKQPLISITIPTHNDESTILQCLNSLADTGYKKLSVVISDSGSTDKTLQIVRRFKKSHTRLKIEIIDKDENVRPKGEMVIHLSPRFALDKHFFTNALRHFALNDINTLIPAVRVKPEKSLLGLLQQYNSLRQNIAGANAAIQSAPYALTRSKPPKQASKTHYADDVLIFASPVPSYLRLLNDSIDSQLNNTGRKQAGLIRQLLNALMSLVLLLEPFVVGYFIYLAVKFQRPEAFALAWALMLFSLFFYIWADHHTRLSEKLRLIFLAPMISSLAYLLSISRALAPIKYLFIKVREDWAKWQPQYYAA